MDLKWIVNFIFVIYINKASLRPRVVYKPTELPYSRCTEHSTNRVTCEKLNISKERQEKKSFWPPGPYAIPMSKYGCPESWSRGWLKSFLKINMNVLASSLEKRNSTVLDYDSLFVDSAFFTPPFQSGDVKLYFCVKFRNEATLDQEQWIPGDYSIYKIGSSCPTDFEESSKTLPVTSLVSYGLVPNITVPKGSSEKFINISMCKRTNFTDTGDNNTNVTFKMLETDFILEKDLDSNCTHFDDVSTVFQGDMHCFYNPNVVEFDYESLTELVLDKGRLSKLHQEMDLTDITEWYFLDCQRSLDVLMIDIKSSQNPFIQCFVNDVPGNLQELRFCNTDDNFGRLHLRRTRGRYFTFASWESIEGVMSIRVFLSSVEAQNGESCFESIEIGDKQVPGSQITVSSAHSIQIPSDVTYKLTGWIPNLTDMTPWILVDLISSTTLEGVGIYFSKSCDRWTNFSLSFGTRKDQLQMYKDMEFRIFPLEDSLNKDQMFTFPRPIKARYVKFNDSVENPTNKPRCLIFQLYGCKLTRFTDINRNSLSEMLPLEQELRSGDSTFVRSTNVEECKALCSSKYNCSVASFSEEKLCYHYMGSELGIWKSVEIANGSQWFAKLQNNVDIVPFPRATTKGAFSGNIQYLDGDSILTSLGYPLTVILDSDVQWIVNFEPQQFAKFVFTNVSLSKSELIVKASQEVNRGFIIDENLNDEVFVLETNQSLLFLTTISKTIWSPTVKFRAIVTAEETPACFSLVLDILSKTRKELCNEPSMILTSLSYLNLDQQLKKEEFIIQAGKHQSIDLIFVDFYMPCYSKDFNVGTFKGESYTHVTGPFRSKFAIKDVGSENEFCTGVLPPDTYKSKGSIIHLHYRPHRFRKYPRIIGERIGQNEGFRIQYKISEHSFEKYTTETKGNKSLPTACSRLFKKCYTVFSEKVSWDIANDKCRKRNEHLVTITSRKEMTYIQYLLRSALYYQRKTELKNELQADDQKLNGAHIGLRRVKDKQWRTNFKWLNRYNSTFSAWESKQPATGDCTRTLFEYFNIEELWGTEDCLYNHVEFFICEKPFSENKMNTKTGVKDDECKTVFRKEDLVASPYSGKTCQNWKNLSDTAKSDFDEKFSSSETALKNSTLCTDVTSNDIPWCYVNDPGEFLLEPCFLQLNITIGLDKSNASLPEKKRISDKKCIDGSSIPRVNWCDRNFDCSDYTDELSCQDSFNDHNLTNVGNTMINSNLPRRLEPGAYFHCEESKEWISMLAQCDDVIDCLDASDEINCSHSNIACEDNEFLCDDGHCVKLSQVCDFISDCGDGSDEFCEYQVCNVNEFRCENRQCIQAEKRCNAIYDCVDHSDEINCDSCQKSFLCADDYKCIPHRLTCDGYFDCRDNSDERLCVGNPPTSEDFSGNYIWTGKLSDEMYSWNFITNKNESGSFTFLRHRLLEIFAVNDIKNEVFGESYTCFIKVQANCKLRFREAASVDNYNNDFAYPACHCTIGTFKIRHIRQMYSELDMVSLKRCDGSEITESHVAGESITDIKDVFGTIYRDPNYFLDMTPGHPYCTYEYNASVFGEFFHCKRDDRAIPESMMCIYAVDASGYMTGCRSGDHLQNCENFLCPENTVKCPGSYCIEQRFLCDGQSECPGGEDEQNCTCIDSDREVIIFVEDQDLEAGEAAMHLAKQFFTSTQNSVIRLFYFKSLHRSMKFHITYKLLEIREERLNQVKESECKKKTLARDFLKMLHFSKPEKGAIIVFENSDESSIVADLALSNLSEPAFAIYRVIRDFNSSLYKDDTYKFVKDIHISKWSSLYSTGFRRFPEICTEASLVPCAGKYRCSSSKQCIPLEQVCDNVIHCRNGDDERLCDSLCPPKCYCVGEAINCRAANISLSDISALTMKVRSADLSLNPKITKIHNNSLRFPYMFRLNLSSCDIQDIDKKAFHHLQYLLSLDLSSNRIRRLPPKIFSKLRNLTHLNLNGNFELTEISSTSFKGLKALRSLKITGTKLKKINSHTFSGLQLDSIDISNNKIEEIEDYAFNNSVVHKINFEGNNVIRFRKKMFYGIRSLRELHTPAFKFCCIRPCYVPEENCKPVKNEFSSCEDLMRNSVLQAVLWIVGLSSLCGNLSSIIYRLVYDRERLKIGYGIFVTNLAVADFFMGVYLIMIAVADSLFRDRYIYEDEQWRNSNWCVTAGVLSTISSEASVFFLCLITLDRLLVIKFPFGGVRFGPLNAYICCGICWFISITLSIIPIIYTSHFQNKFYSKTGVCIALPLTRDKPPGWIYSVSIFVGLNFVTFILVAIGQISIFTELRRAASVMKKTQKSRKRDLKVARNLILVATTDFLCWFPIGVMGILALSGYPIPGDVYAWTAVFILPINSALNPFLYTLTAILGKKSFNPSIDEQTRTMVQKEIGNAILEYQKFARYIRIKREYVPVETMRSIEEILNDDGRLSVYIVAAVSKQLTDYLRLLHESFVVLDKICETNIYIKLDKKNINNSSIEIDAKLSIAADERPIQENIRQFGILLRKLVLKCEKRFEIMCET